MLTLFGPVTAETESDVLQSEVRAYSFSMGHKLFPLQGAIADMVWKSLPRLATVPPLLVLSVQRRKVVKEVPSFCLIIKYQIILKNVHYKFPKAKMTSSFYLVCLSNKLKI